MPVLKNGRGGVDLPVGLPGDRACFAAGRGVGNDGAAGGEPADVMMALKIEWIWRGVSRFVVAALPNELAGCLVDRAQRAILGPGRKNRLLAIDQDRSAAAPLRNVLVS